MISTFKRHGRIAGLVVIALVAVVAPADASQPGDKCPTEQAARVEIVQRAEVVEVAMVQALRVHEAALEQLEMIERAEIEAVRVYATLDRDHPAKRFDFEFDHADWSPEPEPQTLWSAGIDTFVGITQLPARASVVAQHLIGAFAKVTPRVVRAVL